MTRDDITKSLTQGIEDIADLPDWVDILGLCRTSLQRNVQFQLWAKPNKRQDLLALFEWTLAGLSDDGTMRFEAEDRVFVTLVSPEDITNNTEEEEE